MAIVEYIAAVLGLGGIVLGLMFVLTGVQHYQESYRLRGQELSPIESLEPGQVSVSGTARPADDGVLPAPFTDRDSLAAEYTVREVQGKNSQTPTKIADGVESVPFYVDDGTGRVLVRPEAADLELGREEEIMIERDEEYPEPIQRFLSQRADIGEPAEPTVDIPERTIGTRYFREELLEPGEEVYVFGKATEHQSREFDETVLEIREGAAGGHPDETTFIVADRPKEEVPGGHKSGGLMSIVLGGVIIAIGCAFVFSTSFV